MSLGDHRERLHALAEYAADLIDELRRVLFNASEFELHFTVTDAGVSVESVCVFFEEYGDSGDIRHTTEPVPRPPQAP